MIDLDNEIKFIGMEKEQFLKQVNYENDSYKEIVRQIEGTLETELPDYIRAKTMMMKRCLTMEHMIWQNRKEQFDIINDRLNSSGMQIEELIRSLKK